MNHFNSTRRSVFVRARAVRLAHAFMRKVVANLDNDWVLTGADIDAAIAEIEACT